MVHVMCLSKKTMSNFVQNVLKNHLEKKENVDKYIKRLCNGVVLRKCKHDKIGEKKMYELNSSEIYLQRKKLNFSKISGIIDLREANEVVKGIQSLVHKRNLRNKRIALKEELVAFSITTKGGKKAISFLACSKADRDAIVIALQYIIQHLTMTTSDVKYEYQVNGFDIRLLRYYFNITDSDNNGELSREEILELFKRLDFLKVHDQFKLLEKFGFMDSDNSKMNFVQFMEFFECLTFRSDLEALFSKYSIGKRNEETLCDVKSLKRLLKDILEEEYSKSMCRRFIKWYEPNVSLALSGRISFAGLSRIMLLKLHAIVDYKKTKDVYQNMNRPLNEYLINTSHNTYLLKDQLFGPMSLEAYTRVLKMGNRCVEIDVHNGLNGKPQVFHRFTPTKISAMDLFDVLVAIKLNAFTKSNYPLILNIENSCDERQQTLMATFIKDVFKDMLAPVELFQSAKILPSPQQLLKRVIIRVISMHFAKIIHIHTCSWSSCLDSSLEISCNESPSIDEKSANRIIEQQPNDFKIFTQKFMTRIYPDKLRATSTNFEPYHYWKYGCQLAALNFQTAGIELSSYFGFFTDNGGCGYILKQSLKEQPVLLHLHLRTGQNLLPITTIDKHLGIVTGVYVEILIHGNQSPLSARTHLIEHDALNPVFDKDFFFNIENPELAAVHFLVKTQDSIIISGSCVPFNLLKKGFRHVRLLNKYGKILPNSTLFVNVACNSNGESEAF